MRRSRNEAATVRANVARLRRSMAAAGLDAVVAVSPENVLYLSGAFLLISKLDPARLAAVVFVRDARHGDPVAIVHATEEAVTRRDTWIADVRTYADGKTSCLALAAAVVQERGLATGRIGLEHSWLPIGHYQTLRSLLPGATLAAADEALAQARLIKTPGEVELLRRATLATDDAFRSAFAAARAGDSEQALASDICGRLLQAGADGTWMTLSSGENLHVRHHLPGGRCLRAGDLILAVGGGSFGGYYSNQARMAVVGTPSDTRARRYRWLYATLQHTISQMRAGMTVAAVYQAASDAYAAAGHAFASPAVGHSIGLHVHDWLMLRAGDETVLQPGMTLQIEHGLPDGEGLRLILEDLTIIGEGDSSPVSAAPWWQELPVIAA